MNKKRWLIGLGLSLWAQIALPQSDQTFNLPNSKIYLQSCQTKALAIHPGKIYYQRALQRDAYFLLEFNIKGENYVDWVILCDGLKGEILKEFKIDLNIFP